MSRFTKMLSFTQRKNTLGAGKSPAVPPALFLNQISATYPRLWKEVDKCRREALENNPAWPSACFMPDISWAMAACREDVFQLSDCLPPNHPIHTARAIHGLRFFGSWRLGKGVYRFAPMLYQELMKTPVTGDIPIELLYRLPEWAVYIETPDLRNSLNLPVRGIGACLCHHNNLPDSLELSLFCEHPDGSLAIDKHTVLLAGGSIHDCVDALDAENRAAQSRSGVAYDFPAFNKKFWIPFTEKVLSLLLWLCSEEPEIGASAPPTHPKPVKTKQGMRFFSADNVAVWNVGARIGAALLAAKTVSAAATAGSEAGTHARPRGHIRRAHWHTYLTGPKDNPTRVLRWISPVFVNLAPDNLMPSVIHEVA